MAYKTSFLSIRTLLELYCKALQLQVVKEVTLSHAHIRPPVNIVEGLDLLLYHPG
jgi:hypothetical protein